MFVAGTYTVYMLVHCKLLLTKVLHMYLKYNAVTVVRFYPQICTIHDCTTNVSRIMCYEFKIQTYFKQF